MHTQTSITVMLLQFVSKGFEWNNTYTHIGGLRAQLLPRVPFNRAQPKKNIVSINMQANWLLGVTALPLYPCLFCVCFFSSLSSILFFRLVSFVFLSPCSKYIYRCISCELNSSFKIAIVYIFYFIGEPNLVAWCIHKFVCCLYFSQFELFRCWFSPNCLCQCGRVYVCVCLYFMYVLHINSTYSLLSSPLFCS